MQDTKLIYFFYTIYIPQSMLQRSTIYMCPSVILY